MDELEEVLEKLDVATLTTFLDVMEFKNLMIETKRSKFSGP